jgi:fumarylacetoacetate (FAA) hydrolase
VKLASLPYGRDGRLVVVSDDLAWYADADHLAPTMQALLDDWDRLAPAIESLAIELAHGAIPRKRFHEREAAAPLPRAYQWAAGGADAGGDPLIYQRAGDDLRPARSPIELSDEEWDCDFAAEVCVVTADVAQGTRRADALDLIRLVGLVNDLSLGKLATAERAKGFGPVQSRPAPAFSPVFVTPDALGDDWREGRLHLAPLVHLTRTGSAAEPVSRGEAGQERTVDFGTLIAHLALTRRLGAGSIVGSSTASSHGTEQRSVGTPAGGEPTIPYLRWGDCVRIETRDRRGRSVFGAIEQLVVRP